MTVCRSQPLRFCWLSDRGHGQPPLTACVRSRLPLVLVLFLLPPSHPAEDAAQEDVSEKAGFFVGTPDTAINYGQTYMGEYPRICDAASLRIVQCPDQEGDINWPEFLELACQFCPTPGYPCEEQPASDRLVWHARDIVNKAEDNPLGCAPGLIAAMIVASQFFLVKDGTPGDLEQFLSKNLSLAPFPFDTLQYSLYTNMVPARLTVCDNSLAKDSKMFNTFVPRVNTAETGGRCGMIYDDAQLVRKCRTRRFERLLPEGREEFLSSIQCPVDSISMDADLATRLQKYSDRGATPSKQCQNSRGMWRQPMSDVHKCILITVGHLLGFRPGQLMLDWGSGCGHKVSWAKMLFDVDGVGIDVEGSAVAWANRHSAGKFCHGDGRELAWVPDGVFDYVFSYAAIYHLSKVDQCRTGIQLVSKLKVGGKAYFGWNQDYSMTHWEWRHCLTRPESVSEIGIKDIEAVRSMKIDMEALEDGFLFPPNAEEGSEHYLFQYPAYSIFLTRLG